MHLRSLSTFFQLSHEHSKESLANVQRHGPSHTSLAHQISSCPNTKQNRTCTEKKRGESARACSLVCRARCFFSVFENRIAVVYLLLFFCFSGILLGPRQWLGDLICEISCSPGVKFFRPEEPNSEPSVQLGKVVCSAVSFILRLYVTGKEGGKRLLLKHACCS